MRCKPNAYSNSSSVKHTTSVEENLHDSRLKKVDETPSTTTDANVDAVAFCRCQVVMNGATVADTTSIRNAASQQRESFVTGDDLTMNQGGGSGQQQLQSLIMYPPEALSRQPQQHNDPSNVGNGSARSHSASSSTGSSSGGVGNVGVRMTPPALQLPLAASMFNAQMLSHYGSSLNAVAALNGAGATFRAPSMSMGGNGMSALRQYTCKLCNDMFDTKAELQLHAQVHMREAKPYKCSHCPKSFANSSYLSQHMRIHLGIKPFGPCQYCQRKFTQLSHLQQHLRTHTGDKPYKCRYPNCEKAFSQLSNLQSHSRCHQTDKPFKCNSCYKCFADEQSLLEHIPKHKESKHLKVHICSFCGKSYTQATYLAKHMTKHADRKPLKGTAPSVLSGGHSVVTSGGGCMSSSDDHHHAGMWSPRDTSATNGQSLGNVCAIHGVADSCNDLASPNAFPFNSFHQQLNPMMQGQTCAYTSGIASTMAAAAGMGATDPSAFTRLAGLAPAAAALQGRFQAAAAASRNPYAFPYDNFKSPAHAAGSIAHHTTTYNQLIRLDDIRNYAGHQAAAAASAEHFGTMLMKHQQQQQQQQQQSRDHRDSTPY